MTAQFDDLMIHRRRRYSIAGISAGELFDVASLGLNPVMASTACYRGYLAIFATNRKHLILDSIYVNHVESSLDEVRHANGPVINGVKPLPCREDDLFNNYYKKIKLPIAYSGGLMLGSGFIDSLYVHMGYHAAWKYERVIELLFESGRLIGELDRSDEMRALRDRATDPDHCEAVDPVYFINRSFDRRYED